MNPRARRLRRQRRKDRKSGWIDCSICWKTWPKRGGLSVEVQKHVCVPRAVPNTSRLAQYRAKYPARWLPNVFEYEIITEQTQPTYPKDL